MICQSGLILCLSLIAFPQGSLAWGGLFNRFNPSMLSNLGYGGSGGSYASKLYGANERAMNKIPNGMIDESIEAEEAALAAQEDDEDDPCVGKRCTANEHCCDGHVCVDTEDETNEASFGSCLPIFGKKQGEPCYRDNDCETGFLCTKDDDGYKRCEAPAPGAQGLGEDCRASSDCNISKGLCCKLQRRARSQPKKICTYFTDPAMCVGQVASSMVKSSIEHTAGEKRLSGHPDYHHLR